MMNVNNIKHPKVALIRQKLFKTTLNDIKSGLEKTFSLIQLEPMVKPGQTVAVAVGSRGISRIDRIVYHCLNFLKSKGLRPYIVPAMGSHGGGTAQGQIRILKKLGMTQESMNVPILPDMEVMQLAKLKNDISVYFSKAAKKADHIVVINRIKPHTKFSAEIESGLCKMMTIGLGKVEGATEYHKKAVFHTFGIIEDAARVILEKSNILFGLGLLEDGYGNPSHMEALLPSGMIEREKELLDQAASMMGRIPFDHVDILVVDYIGKNISGIGMDSNITGRHRDIVGDFNISPHIKRIFVRDLSSESDGNANGIGLADFTTKRLIDSMDLEKTYTNSLAAISPEKAAIPIHFDTDMKVLNACVASTGFDSLEEARAVRIKDTAHLELLQVTKAFDRDINKNPNIEQLTPWEVMSFDQNGNLTRFPE